MMVWCAGLRAAFATRGVHLAVAGLVAANGFAACALNPKPLPPEEAEAVAPRVPEDSGVPGPALDAATINPDARPPAFDATTSPPTHDECADDAGRVDGGVWLDASGSDAAAAEAGRSPCAVDASIDAGR